MKATKMGWRDARQKAGMTIDDVIVLWRTMPDSIQGELSRSKLSRLETGANTKLTPMAMAYLAGLYDQPLSVIEPKVAAEYRALMEAAPSPTCGTASPELVGSVAA